MNINQTAFYTVTTLAVATIGSTVLAVTATATVATVAYATLAALGSALSIASMTAYASLSARTEKEDSASEYFTEVFSHAGITIATVFQGAAQFLVITVANAVGEGIGRGVSKKTEKWITG